MADSSFSSDVVQEASPVRSAKPRKKKSGKTSASASHGSHLSKGSATADKDALRCHRALERQWEKAKLAAALSSNREAGSCQQSPSVPDRSDPRVADPVPLTLRRGVSIYAGCVPRWSGFVGANSPSTFCHFHTHCGGASLSGPSLASVSDGFPVDALYGLGLNHGSECTDGGPDFTCWDLFGRAVCLNVT